MSLEKPRSNQSPYDKEEGDSKSLGDGKSSKEASDLLSRRRFLVLGGAFAAGAVLGEGLEAQEQSRRTDEEAFSEFLSKHEKGIILGFDVPREEIKRAIASREKDPLPKDLQRYLLTWSENLPKRLEEVGKKPAPKTQMVDLYKEIFMFAQAVNRNTSSEGKGTVFTKQLEQKESRQLVDDLGDWAKWLEARHLIDDDIRHFEFQLKVRLDKNEIDEARRWQAAIADRLTDLRGNAEKISEGIVSSLQKRGFTVEAAKEVDVLEVRVELFRRIAEKRALYKIED